MLGLAWAGSPYAYQSMGSCLAIPSDSYAKVRGFPRKNAAKDFYALDKLAKVGRIERLAGTALSLEGRPSDRVPFGTGRALRDLTGKRKALSNFRLYHPLVFAHVSAWLQALERIATSGCDLERALATLPTASPFFRTDLLREALANLRVAEAVAQARARSSDAATLRRHLHTWFDAFRTLKLAHALRDGGLASLPWRQSLAEAPFTRLAGSTQDEPETLRRALAKRERTLAATPAGVPAVGRSARELPSGRPAPFERVGRVELAALEGLEDSFGGARRDGRDREGRVDGADAWKHAAVSDEQIRHVVCSPPGVHDGSLFGSVPISPSAST